MKRQYNTKHKDALLTYLKSRPGVHMTAADVCSYFRAEGESIGTTTVYRQLDRLVDEGLVSKYFIDENSPACFEYLDPSTHAGAVCYHCKCERCGRLFHTDCAEIAELEEHLFSHHGFKVDPMRTVFYGVCGDCLGKDKEAEV